MVSAEESGTIRIEFADSEENTGQVVADFHTSETSSAAKAYPTDRDALALPKMPYTNVWANENAKIVIKVKGDAADTIESEESNGFFPILLKHKASGAVIHKKLRLGDDGTADFSGFNSTADVVLNTSTFERLGAFTVPYGYMATLDAGQSVHCYLGDDTA